MRKIIGFLISLSLAFSLSCEKEVALSSALLEKKLVVQSYISPQDTLIQVRVSTTNPLVGKVDSTNRWVNDASVVLSDDQQEMVLANTGQGIYSRRADSKFRIQPGKSYRLRVSTPDGRSVRSSCRVPLVSFSVGDIIVEKQIIDDQRFKCTITWPVQENQKSIVGIWAGFTRSATQCGSAKTSYLADPGSNKTTQRFTTGLFFNVCNPDNSSISVVLYVFDENFYTFYNTLDQQTQTNGMPFTEPVQLYTNVEGGYGLFAAYTGLKKTVSL